jgi:hypothetical protein
MSSFLTVSVGEYSVAVDHEARAPQASMPPRVATRVNAAPTPADIPVGSAAGKASTSWPSRVFFGDTDASAIGCARAPVATTSTSKAAAVAHRTRRTVGRSAAQLARGADAERTRLFDFDWFTASGEIYPNISGRATPADDRIPPRDREHAV